MIETPNTQIDFCRKLISERFPQLFINDQPAITVINEGWSSLVLDINNEYIFRFPRLPEIKAGYEKEARLLPKIATALPLAVPDFQFVWLEDEDPLRCFVGYRKIHGQPITAQIASLPKTIQQVANFLSQLHGFPSQNIQALGLPQNSTEDWRRDYQRFYQWIQANILPMLQANVQEYAARLWQQFLENDAYFRFQPVLIHRDLGEEHILWQPESQDLSGVIDWEDATLGDPALDFVGLLQVGGSELVDKVSQAYQGELGETFKQRVAFYHLIVPFYQIQYGLLIKDEHHVESGLQKLTEDSYTPPVF